VSGLNRSSPSRLALSEGAMAGSWAAWAGGLGIKRARAALHKAVDDVVLQVAPCRSHRVAFWPTESDPCLQVADYCAWAIQRKWEGDDPRSHALIAPKIMSEFDAWRGSRTFYF
jgi:hypothetical protein